MYVYMHIYIYIYICLGRGSGGSRAAGPERTRMGLRGRAKKREQRIKRQAKKKPAKHTDACEPR